MGATHVINVREQDAGEEIKTITNGRGVDAAWETAGNPAALQSALASVRRGGKLAIVGLPSQNEIPLNVPFIADNEIDIYGIFRYANTYPKGIEFRFRHSGHEAPYNGPISAGEDARGDGTGLSIQK